MNGELVTLTRGRSWELTTEHGTRIILALGGSGSRSQWMRLPATLADGTINRGPDDWRWQRLFGIRQVDDEGQHGQTGGGGRPVWRVRIGAPVTIYVGMSEWWTTTDVVAIREIEAADLPQERRIRAT